MDDELKDCRVDLIETFSYLIGFYVEQTETIRAYKIVRGKNSRSVCLKHKQFNVM